MNQQEKISAVIQVLEQKQFYGELQLKFEGGKVVLCKKIESLKLQ